MALTVGERLGGYADETPVATASARHIQVVLNWTEELKQRVPVR
jgi:hypothetical protein